MSRRNRRSSYERPEPNPEAYLDPWKDAPAPPPDNSTSLLPPAPEQDVRITDGSTLNNENVGYDTKSLLDPYDGILDSIENGAQNKPLREKQPQYNKTKSETVYSGDNNTHIILGRDRWGGPETGYGGLGHTRAGAIDIVVGLQGWAPAEAGEELDNGRWRPGAADKNFGSLNRNISPGDAARIYISQRTDIDDYFDICDGFVGRSYSDSAIAMKADSIRILARKGIKLVTQRNPPGRNSINGKIGTVYGIDLIAGNRDMKTGLDGLTPGNPEFPGGREINYLQPIPKGDNLQEYLAKLHDNVQLVNSILTNLIQITWAISDTVIAPQIVTPGVTIPTPPSFADVIKFLSFSGKEFGKLLAVRGQMFAYKMDYLDPFGAIYINSRHNRTN
jgi:hypothetical protein